MKIKTTSVRKLSFIHNLNITGGLIMSNIILTNTAKIISETAISSDILAPNSKHILATSSWSCAGMIFEVETGTTETMIRSYDQYSNGLSASNSLDFEEVYSFRVDRYLMADLLDSYEDDDVISELVLTVSCIPDEYSVEALVEYVLDVHKISGYPIGDIFRGLRSMRTCTFLEVLEGKVSFDEAV